MTNHQHDTLRETLVELSSRDLLVLLTDTTGQAPGLRSRRADNISSETTRRLLGHQHDLVAELNYRHELATAR